MATSATDTDRLRLFILAGEPSGDRIAADLVARLKTRVSLQLEGVGGQELIAQGLDSLYPMSDLAVMGITDVVFNLPRLLWRLEQTARAIIKSSPDMVVLVDAQDFSRLLAQKLRRRGFAGKLVLYVAPSVWARNPGRAVRLKPLFDAVLAVLPFEPAVMDRLGGPTTHYVGHPALADALPTTKAATSGALILLPGSRAGELHRHLPLLRTLAPRLAALPGVTELVLPTLPGLHAQLERELRGWDAPVRLVTNRAERHALYADAMAAICVSGTVTLELALARVPMIVVYGLDSHQARVYEKLSRPQVSLPNIILDRPVVGEYVATPLPVETIAAASTALLSNEKARQAQIDAFGELERLMVAGEPPYFREDPADRILVIWQDQREPISS